MQQDINQIMATVTSPATAGVARQELLELAAQREREHARRVTELERERDQHAAELGRERAARNALERRVQEQECERDQRAAELQRERDQLVTALEQRVRELEHAQQRAATLERERDCAAAERDAALEKHAAARRDRFALRQHVAKLEEEQVGLRNKFSLTRQDDLLRHVLSATVDFDHFTVRKMVAAGGFGVVLLCDVTVPAWCVTDDGAGAAPAAARGVGRPTAKVAVAVKVLAGVADPRHTTLKHTFLREFQTLSDMPPHPNVITLLAFLTKRLPKPMFDLLPDGFRLMVGGAANPVLALIMPLHPRTLEAAAAAGAEPAQLVQWCLDVSAAVAHMWEYRWVHLDLKLNNVLVTGDGRAVLTDMGTAMPVAADGSLTVPAHMGLAGNPAHRAPEVLASWEEAARVRDPAAQVRMDAGRQEVWALGVLLHELVAGKHPYGEEYPGEGHDGAPVVDEATLVARGLPADTVALVCRMVSRDPAERPADPAAAHVELVASVPPAQHPAPATPAPASLPAPPATLASPALVSPAPPATPASASPAPPAPPAEPAVSLCDVEHAYHASRLNLLRDPATGKPVPNEWGRQLQAWSEEHDAARLFVALLLWCGWGGLQRDPAKARALAERSMSWCLGAAEDGEAVAQWLLGECCFWGMGGAKSRAQAVAWFRRAAEQGHAEGQRQLGACCFDGEGLAKDRAQAAAWFRRAAEQGHAWGQYDLGACCYDGQGVAMDREQAAAWFRRAAEQGQAEGQHELGECYFWGMGVAQDHTQAAAWYRRAAEQGHAYAQDRLRALGE